MILFRSLLLVRLLTFCVGSVTQKQWLFAIYQKHSRNFRQNVNGKKKENGCTDCKMFEINEASWKVVQIKCSTEILEYKCAYHSQFFTTILED